MKVKIYKFKCKHEYIQTSNTHIIIIQKAVSFFFNKTTRSFMLWKFNLNNIHKMILMIVEKISINAVNWMMFSKNILSTLKT